MFCQWPELPHCGRAIHRLLTVGQEEEKREEGMGVRYPFFQTVSIATDDGECQVAFCRDISNDGIGLMHRMPIVPGEVTVTFTSRSGSCTIVSVRIVWCRTSGEGWFISGGYALSAPTVEETEDEE